MKNKNIKIIFLPVIFLFLNCSFHKNEKLSMLSGYIYYGQTNWNHALSDFLRVYQIGEVRKDTEITAYADFALASVYIMQNENEAADKRLSNIKMVENSDFGAAVYYQLGVIAFKKSKYSDAVFLFKKAMEKDPKSIDIKINYELSKKYFDETSLNTPQLNNITVSENDDDNFSEVIINIINEKEAEQWQKNNRNTNSENAHDY